MAQQTYLALLVDKDGVMKDFWRFSCKRASTAERQIREAAKEGHTGLKNLLRKLWKREGVVACEIYATPSGVTEGKPPVRRFSMDWAT